jgi:S-adenosylmethionine synthetase
VPYQFFTSESVCAGHPDKICDQVSDAIVDAVLAQDPYAHLGVETAVTENRLILLGEVKTSAKVDYEQIARSEIKRLGYTDTALGFSDHAIVECYIAQQSSEIAQGVDPGGAGDQGMMFGYACRETPELMPLPITLAHQLTKALDEARETKKLDYLLPDGKAQVTVRYKDDKAVEVTHVTMAAPHRDTIKLDQVKSDLIEHVILPVLARYKFSIPADKVVINGTGIWHNPGPKSDAGLTGRKVVVDTYGGYARVGGGAFSGKCPTKVDRSGAYAARYLAKNIVAAGLADRAEVALAYYIGAIHPVMQEVETFGTEKASPKELQDFMKKTLDTSVAGITKAFDLRRPIYRETAAYGHFGNPNYPWEKLA